MTAEPGRRPPGDRQPLDRELLTSRTRDRPGLRLVVVDESDSTNHDVARRAAEGAPDGLVVVAEHQSAGRGRLDRRWVTPRGTSLTFSLLVRPGLSPSAWPWLPLLSGLAVTEALRADGFAADVKWPNDVLLGPSKVAGILVERVETPQGAAAVIGVGLNVSLRPDELPVPTATSLEIASGRPVDRSELLVRLLTTLREAYDAWHGGGDVAAARLLEAYAGGCVTVGRRVRVALPDGSDLVGQATTVDAGGRLEVRRDDGAVVAVSAGDVVHVRPVD